MKAAWRYLKLIESVMTVAHVYGYAAKPLYMNFILVPGWPYLSLVAK